MLDCVFQALDALDRAREEEEGEGDDEDQSIEIVDLSDEQSNQRQKRTPDVDSAFSDMFRT